MPIPLPGPAPLTTAANPVDATFHRSFPAPAEHRIRDQAFVDLAAEPALKPRINPRLAAIKRLAGVEWENAFSAE